MTTDKAEAARLADDLEGYASRYAGDRSQACPTVSWAQLDLIVAALRRSPPTDNRGNYEDRHPQDQNEERLMPLSDINDLDEVCAELGIQDSHVTPAEAVRELKAEIEALRRFPPIQAGAREAVDDGMVGRALNAWFASPPRG